VDGAPRQPHSSGISLVSTYRSQGRRGEADTLEARVLGQEHPDTIEATANLASTYSQQGAHSEAKTLKLEVLENPGKVLGMAHPSLPAVNLAVS
jgi:hypothetical protein